MYIKLQHMPNLLHCQFSIQQNLHMVFIHFQWLKNSVTINTSRFGNHVYILLIRCVDIVHINEPIIAIIVVLSNI